MAESELCWECKEKARGYVRLNPWVHCHHEPKEKSKCWCMRNSGPGKHSIIGDETVKVIFCPECGRML